MTFMRTAAGIANYAHFHGAQIVVFTEGSLIQNNSEAQLDDQSFYESVLSYVMPNTKFKIKCVGNKHHALEYAKRISESNIKDEIVCIDRDLSGLTHSFLPMKCVVQTWGYSWENDLWSIHTSKSLIKDLTQTEPVDLTVRFDRLEKRLHALFSLDVSLQIYGQPLLKKESATGGINLQLRGSQPVPLIEVKRLIGLYRATPAASCPVSSSIRRLAMRCEAQRVIQGHIWSNALRGLLMQIYKQQTKDGLPSKRMLLNLALSTLGKNPPALLDAKVVDHYRDSVIAALV